MILMASRAIVTPTVAFAEARQSADDGGTMAAQNATIIVEFIAWEGDNNGEVMYATAQTPVPTEC